MFPSADHVKLSQEVAVSEPVLELVMVKFNVTTESQPAAFVSVAV